jgi:hypothetical protein
MSVVISTVLAIIGLALLSPCWPAAPGKSQPGNSIPSDPEKKFGITILSQMLDLRFQVVDPERAKPVLDKNKKAFLLDGMTGKALPVPVTKVGSWRQATPNPEAGRVYFILFSNPNGMVKENGKVSLIIGDFRKDDIVVEGSGAAPASNGKPPQQKAGEAGKP